MSVSRETVLHTSLLARLDLARGSSGDEAESKISAFAREMDGIVEYMDILALADTEGVEPLFSPLQHTAPPRADEAISAYSREEVLSNAPDADNGFFVVPQVL